VAGRTLAGTAQKRLGGRRLAGTAQTPPGGSLVVDGTILVEVEREQYVDLIRQVESTTYSSTQIVTLRELPSRSIPVPELAEAIAAARHRGLAVFHRGVYGGQT
jgi:lipoate-protein ligase A